MAGVGVCGRVSGLWHGLGHVARVGTCCRVWGHVAGCGSMWQGWWQGVRACGRGGVCGRGVRPMT